jgi:dihydrofolate synthase/folylpolyglutamate synthase
MTMQILPAPQAHFRTPADAFAWVESFTNLERGTVAFDSTSYHLRRIRLLLDMVGSPEKGMVLVHVAGTKGKGSTAALIASVLAASGRRTGLYTSPHVADPFERIVLAGRRDRPATLVRCASVLRAVVDALPPEPADAHPGAAGAFPPGAAGAFPPGAAGAFPPGAASASLPGAAGAFPPGAAGAFPPTTFELYTALAFLYFRDAGCDSAVIEVGIGGRLDATNVITPEASVITPLDLEHTDVLGDTIEKIAAEKAGIIKPGVPVFVGLQPPAAAEVFRAVAREQGSPITFLADAVAARKVRVSPSGTDLHIALRDGSTADFRLSMLGEFQAENAALAYVALRSSHPEISLSQYGRGFRAARLPGRMELVRGRPPVVLDGAHTPLAVQRLVESFQAVFPGARGPGGAVLLFGSVTGKNPKAMAEILAPCFASIIVSTPGTFKPSDPQGVWRIFHDLAPGTELVRDPGAALARARELARGKLPILVTGSFYMVSEIRRLL